MVWYINKMPTPFSKQATQPTPAGEKDPGKPAQGAPANTNTGLSAPARQAGDPIRETLPVLRHPARQGRGKGRSAAPAKPDAKESKDGEKEQPKESIFLQAGSFQNAGDADNQKARLALLGMEASIQQVMVQDKTWFRVRLGPYARIEEVNKVRSELAKQGIEAALVKKD